MRVERAPQMKTISWSFSLFIQKTRKLSGSEKKEKTEPPFYRDSINYQGNRYSAGDFVQGSVTFPLTDAEPIHFTGTMQRFFKYPNGWHFDLTDGTTYPFSRKGIQTEITVFPEARSV